MASRASSPISRGTCSSLRVDYTYTMARNDVTDEALSRRPKHKASLNATWQVTERASLSGTVLYTGPWIDSNRSGTMAGSGGEPLYAGQSRRLLRSRPWGDGVRADR